MLVLPYCANLFRDRQDLHKFLLECQQVSIEKGCTQIASISAAIAPIDPLIVFQALARADQLNFYFEKRNTSEHFDPIDGNSAIAAIGEATSLKTNGRKRFYQAEKFTEKCLKNTIKVGNLNLPFSGPHFFSGFTFFEHPDTQISYFPAATVFLPRWQVSQQGDRCTAVANLEVNAVTNLEVEVDRIWTEFTKIRNLENQSSTVQLTNSGNFQQRDITSANHLKNSVLSALNYIQSNQFQKIVLAHAIDVTSQQSFDLIHSLKNLRQFYPDCYVFCVGNGQGQNFIGASPERLLSLHDRELLTDALAGSSPRGKTALEDTKLAQNLLGNAKEIWEHQVVINFLTQRLSNLGLTPRFMPRPRLLRLSNIQHLRTPIRARVPANIHLLKILAELHPTPAVAGAPREIACEHIQQYEKFERSLYAAPLGWLDHKGNGEFIVGIRSALVNGCQARLFAGAGIVAGSDPYKELTEIQLKLQALLQALV